MIFILFTAKSSKTKQGITLDGKSVARSDGQGAVTGGLIGAGTGTCLAGPVGTVAGGIAGAAEGAAIASLAEVVWQLFGW